MKTVTLDGSNALHRLYHALPFLTTSSGQPIQLVYGFLKLLRSVLMQYQPDAAVVCWDVGLPRIRIEMWEGYKRNRILGKANPDPKKKLSMSTIAIQSEMLKELLPLLGVCHIGIDGLEADDLIAMSCQALPGKKIIVSSDTDTFQLVKKGVSVFAPQTKNFKGGKLYHYKNFEKHHGVSPRRYFECKVLAGDSTDEIPGIAPGFGEKTAKDLIQKHGSISNLMDLATVMRSSECVGKDAWSKREKLICSEGADEIVKRNTQLMDLNLMSSKTATKLIRNMVLSPKKVDIVEVRKYLQQKEFNSLLEDFLGWIGPFKSLARR